MLNLIIHHIGLIKMKQEEIECLEAKLNKPSRLRVSSYDGQILKHYQMLSRVVLDGNVASVKKLFAFLLENGSEADESTVGKIALMYRDYCNAKKDGQSKTEQELGMKIGTALKRQLEKEEVNFLYGKCGNIEAISAFLADKKPEEKNRLCKKVLEYYRSSATSDVDFVKVNKILPHFGCRLVRKVLGVQGEERLSLTAEERDMYRAVFAGKFYSDSPEAAHSEAYTELMRNKNLRTNVNTWEYNLLETNPSLKLVSESHNIQKIVPQLESMLSNYKVPPEMARRFNSVDFGIFVRKINAGKENADQFAALDPACVDAPRQEFCKELMRDAKRREAIKNDFLDAGIDKDYYQLWEENMIKIGNPNPDVKGRKFERKVPKKIDLHHKERILTAKSLEVSDKSKMILMMQFDDNMMHDFEHYGDSPVMTLNQAKSGSREESLLKREPKAGEIGVVESLVYDNGSGKDNRCYVSTSLTLCADMSGCHDLQLGRNNRQVERKKAPAPKRSRAINPDISGLVGSRVVRL